MKLPRPCLMLVTDPGTPELLSRVEAAVLGGVDVVQLRDNQAGAAELFEVARRLRGLVRGRALMVVNRRLDVALAAGADGVHLPEVGPPVRAVRALAPRLLVGRSVHSAEISFADDDAPDYLLLGTLYRSPTKPHVVPHGPAVVATLARRTSTPVLGIGGIDAEQAGEVMAAGAAGVAVISSILASSDPQHAARRLRAALEREAAA